MRLSLEKKKKKKKNNKNIKLQAAMWRDPRTPHRQPVASERQGTVSNRHLKGNIEEV